MKKRRIYQLWKNDVKGIEKMKKRRIYQLWKNDVKGIEKMKKERIYQLWKNDVKEFEGRLSLEDRKQAEKNGYLVVKTESFYKTY